MSILRQTAEVVGYLTAIGGFLAGLWFIFRRLSAIYDAVMTLLPNGGKSLFDMVTDVSRRVTVIERWLGVDEDELDGYNEEDGKPPQSDE